MWVRQLRKHTKKYPHHSCHMMLLSAWSAFLKASSQEMAFSYYNDIFHTYIFFPPGQPVVIPGVSNTAVLSRPSAMHEALMHFQFTHISVSMSISKQLHNATIQSNKVSRGIEIGVERCVTHTTCTQETRVRVPCETKLQKTSPNLFLKVTMWLLCLDKSNPYIVYLDEMQAFAQRAGLLGFMHCCWDVLSCSAQLCHLNC